MLCFICLEDDLRECYFNCNGHQFHKPCLIKWLFGGNIKYNGIRCPVCNSSLFLANDYISQFRELALPLLIVDDSENFKIMMNHLLTWPFDELVQWAIELSAYKILKLLKNLDNTFVCCKNILPKMLSSPTISSVRWLLGDFNYQPYKIIRREYLLLILINYNRISELYRIYHFCFKILTKEEKIFLGQFLCRKISGFRIFGSNSPYELFLSVSCSNEQDSHYILSELFPICSQPYFRPSLCFCCGFIHSINTIIGLINLNDLFGLDQLSKCFLSKKIAISSKEYKQMAFAVKKSPIKRQIVNLLDKSNQFSKNFTWKTILFIIQIVG